MGKSHLCLSLLGAVAKSINYASRLRPTNSWLSLLLFKKMESYRKVFRIFNFLPSLRNGRVAKSKLLRSRCASTRRSLRTTRLCTFTTCGSTLKGAWLIEMAQRQSIIQTIQSSTLPFPPKLLNRALITNSVLTVMRALLSSPTHI